MQTYSQFQQKIIQLGTSMKASGQCNAYTIDSAKVVALDPTQYQLYWETSNEKLSMYLVYKGDVLNQEPVTNNERSAFLRLYRQHSYEATTYDDIKSGQEASQFWQEFYGLGAGGICRETSWDPATKTRAFQIQHLQNLMACFDCKIMLPIDLITIDHQRPQAGGEMEAVMKVFRAGGLTSGAPKGPKGQAWSKIFKDLVGNGIPDKADVGKGSKYALNNRGAIFCTLVYHANALDELKTMSMHHVVNLRPLCGHCNSPKRSKLRF